MDGIALVARLLLALVFGVAAVAKLLDLSAFRRALAEFGAPERSIGALALLVPLAELATAVALVLAPSARWGAVAAACLLVLFIAAIARAMVRGEAPDCNCFGRLASGVAGRRTLVRNVVLAVPAVFVVAYGAGEGLDEWFSRHSAAEAVAIAAGLCTAVLAVLVSRLWLQNRRLGRDLDLRRETDALFPPGLPVASRAPSFSLPSAGGGTISLDALLERGRPVALVFVSPDCGSCADLLPDLARWQTTLAERITIALPSLGSVSDTRAMAAPHGLENVLVQEEGEVSKRYRARATPSVVIVAPDGRIASGTYQTRMMVEAVVRYALHADPAPVLRILAVNGNGNGDGNGGAERSPETDAPSAEYEPA